MREIRPSGLTRERDPLLDPLYSTPRSLTVAAALSSFLPCRSGVFPEMRTGVEYEAEVKEKQTAVGQKARRYYDQEFKRSAVEMLESGAKSAVQLARELGVSDCSLGKWKKLYGQGSKGLEQQADQERIKALERELVRISRQRDILKKALAILGQSPEDSVP
jgi:transposase